VSFFGASCHPYQVGDLAGLGRRAHLGSGLPAVLTARAETAPRLRSGQPHGLTCLATPDVVVYAAAPALPAGLEAKPSDCRLPCGVASALGRYGYGFPGIVPAPSPRAIARVVRYPAGGLSLGERSRPPRMLSGTRYPSVHRCDLESPEFSINYEGLDVRAITPDDFISNGRIALV
jgi:hypothetical protein